MAAVDQTADRAGLIRGQPDLPDPPERAGLDVRRIGVNQLGDEDAEFGEQVHGRI
ncbi:hypothetical protein [Kitasatospora sp. NPDC094011]|uniref:hypothetical protein n=1 Tax=Kitasatospora sp. NPDC094011 TaxID=3364090 RepID=UPI0037FEC77E